MNGCLSFLWLWWAGDSCRASEQICLKAGRGKTRSDDDKDDVQVEVLGSKVWIFTSLHQLDADGDLDDERWTGGFLSLSNPPPHFARRCLSVQCWRTCQTWLWDFDSKWSSDPPRFNDAPSCWFSSCWLHFVFNDRVLKVSGNQQESQLCFLLTFLRKWPYREH